MRKQLLLALLIIMGITINGYAQCLAPNQHTVANTSLTTAELLFQNIAPDNSWEILLIPGPNVPLPPTANPTISNGTKLYTVDASPFIAENLDPGAVYYYYIRKICSSEVKSAWSAAIIFNTLVCEPINTCIYTFRMTDSADNGWNYAQMQVRQNGIVVATIGSGFTTGSGPVDVTVALCDTTPFDVYWNLPGTSPQQCSVSVLNPFGQTIYTKPAGVGAGGSVVINGITNCSVPNCIVPTFISSQENTTTGLNIDWSAIATTSWDLYITETGSPAPTSATIPTYNDLTVKPFATTIPLASDTAYDVYVRTNCDPTPSEWSEPTVYTTLPSCIKPANLTAPLSGITTTSATLNWTKGLETDSAWEVLLIPGQAIPAFPQSNPITGEGSFLTPVISTASLDAANLEPAMIYHYYVRTVCSENDKSKWTEPFEFHTLTCNPEDKCNYKFILTDSGLNGWNGGRMQVRQNGIVVQTIGQSITGEGPTTVTIPLCNSVPFDLYWSNEGTAPGEIGLTVQNSFTDIIYTKVAGSGNPLEVLYSSVANCLASSCPKPTGLEEITETITTTTADLTWTESGTAIKWEVYIDTTGMPQPINGSPINSGPMYHIVDSLPYHLTGLLPSKSYTYYVRALCSDTDTSVWTVSSPKTFITKPVNDECNTAINIPVNPALDLTQTLAGTTLGATPSILDDATFCIGSDVWYSFVATNTTHIINILNITGPGSSGTKHSLYSGDCGLLTQLYCSAAGSKFSVARNLTIGNTYTIRVQRFQNILITLSTYINFEIAISTPTDITNDECSSATTVIVNEGTGCNAVVYGSLTTATASPQASTCIGTEDDDVWFRFEAISSSLQVSLVDVTGTTDNLNFSIYSGSCDNLALLYCSSSGSLNSMYSNFIPGQVYYLRVWSNSPINQVVNFSVCVKSISNCSTAEPFCGSSYADPYIYQNSTGINSSIGGVACLFTTPNPTYYTLHIGQTGPVKFNILQNTQFNADGSPLGTNLDVDFVAFGPFTSPQSCDQINFSPCAGTPNPCTNNTIFPSVYPFGNIVDCSYDSAFTENLSIPNATAGEYYTVLITNFSGQPGYIRFLQTNFFEPDAGHTLCEDKIQLVSFIDANANGIKENEEANFNLGIFTYQKNNAGIIHNVSSPVGKHTIYDTNPLNTYDFGFTINPEFAAYYSLATTNFNDLNIPVGSGSQILYFPIIITQAYSDVEVSIVPISQARPGFTYSNKIIYKNLGIAPVSGTLTFTKSPAVTINNVSEPTVNTATGFTFDYTNLAADETRSLIVNMDIPNLPVVQLDQVLTSKIGTTSPLNDINAMNNLASVSETIVGSYDPNDKVEAHGPKVEFTQFSQDDYLTYTIRFQNTGNASAINVRVEDLLDSKLDETSIRMVSASHNYTLERVNNKLIWRFNNITLPGAFINEELSHGYVTFKVKVKPGFALGDIIPNTAEIYFDTNPAIITNTVNTEFETSLGNPDFSAGNIMVYPNPANDHVQISVIDTDENIASITLYDMLGKTITSKSNIASKMDSVDVSAFAKGVYTIEIITENKLRQVKKLVIE